jgi:hypothetical protein
MRSKALFAFLFMFAVYFSGCSHSDNSGDQAKQVDENGGAANISSDVQCTYLTAFSINGHAGVITDTNIEVTLPRGTNVAALVADFSTTYGMDITVKVGSVTQVSGATTNNFTNPVTYTATAVRCLPKEYTVTATIKSRITETTNPCIRPLQIGITPPVPTTACPYNLRDTGPAGGLIFYRNPNYAIDGWSCLEAAPSDQNLAYWSIMANVAVPCGTGTGIGTGKANTMDIINQSTDSAAYLCSQTIGGYSDWFLPSKEELNKMYFNLKKGGTDEAGDSYNPVGSFTGYPYWSSSEYSANRAWCQLFNGGSQNYGVKTGNPIDRVRCVRSF